MKLHCFPQNVVFQRASEFFIKRLHLYHNIRQKTLLLLSGGSAVNICKKLADFIKTSDLDYGFLAIGQVDERFIKSQKSKVKSQNYNSKLKNIMNAEIIRKTGLWESCERKGIPYYLVSQEGNLQESAEGYNKILEKLFKEYTYKIGVLGIGEDGHTAGLLPGYERVWNKNRFVVGYDLRQTGPRGPVCPGGVCSRISLTPKALKQLDQAIVVAVGEKKKEAVKKAIDEKNSGMINRIPAVLIQKIPKVDLFTDITEIKFPDLSS